VIKALVPEALGAAGGFGRALGPLDLADDDDGVAELAAGWAEAIPVPNRKSRTKVRRRFMGYGESAVDGPRGGREIETE